MNVTTGVFGFFIPGCAFAAQYRAYRCYQELKRMNDRLEQKPRP